MRGGSGSRRRESAIWLVASPHTTQHAAIHPKSREMAETAFQPQKCAEKVNQNSNGALILKMYQTCDKIAYLITKCDICVCLFKVTFVCVSVKLEKKT